MRTFAVFAAFLAAAFSAQAAEVLLVLAEDGPAYLEAAQAAEMHLLPVAKTVRIPAEALERAARPPAIVTLGTRALRAAIASGTRAPVIAALVPRAAYEHELKNAARPPAGPVTAVFLDQPVARQLEDYLSAGTSLAGALQEVTRGSGRTPFGRALRRAASAPAGLTDGLRAEQDLSVGLTREFFELLAEGSTTAQRPATLADTLAEFIKGSARRQAAWKAAIRASIDARSNRTIVLLIAPLMLGLNILATGGDVMLRTEAGNILILVVGSMLAIAFVATEFVIGRLTRGF